MYPGELVAAGPPRHFVAVALQFPGDRPGDAVADVDGVTSGREPGGRDRLKHRHVEIDGVEYSSLVFSLELAEEPDELHVTLAFHPTVGITDHFYQRYRTVMTVEDDDIVEAYT